MMKTMFIKRYLFIIYNTTTCWYTGATYQYKVIIIKNDFKPSPSTVICNLHNVISK